jgi:hypothetical protein
MGCPRVKLRVSATVSSDIRSRTSVPPGLKLSRNVPQNSQVLVARFEVAERCEEMQRAIESPLAQDCRMLHKLYREALRA